MYKKYKKLKIVAKRHTKRNKEERKMEKIKPNIEFKDTLIFTNVIISYSDEKRDNSYYIEKNFQSLYIP